MSAHTPGPWSVYDAHTDKELYINAGPAFVGTVHVAPHDNGAAEANSRLIAAAPELLARADDMIECLEEMAERGELPGAMPARVKKLRAAIAAATGEKA